MYDLNQLVDIRWNNTNREWYESKGYVFTKRNDIFQVKAKDLSMHSSQKINAICDYCGNEYLTQYSLITNGRKIITKDCCLYCTGKKSSDISKIKRAKKYIGLANEICIDNGYTLLTTIEEYIDLKMNISFICHIHGIQFMMLDNFLRGHKCKECSYGERGDNLKHSKEYIIHKIEEIKGNILLNPDEYKDVFSPNLRIKCKCGKIFTTSFANYVRANVNSCFSCSNKESSGESKIREFLDKHKIFYIQEKRFDDCRDKKPLPFDFYLPFNNMIIEFDGQHHYFPTYNKVNFEQTIKHDKLKNQYCKSKNIDIIRIPYWNGSSINTILANSIRNINR